MAVRFRGVALMVCAVLTVSLALAGSAHARRRGSNFLMTPNGPVPRSVMYGNYMNPQQLAASQKAEQAQYMRMMKVQNPAMYKEYMAQKKAQQSSGSGSGSNKK